MEIKPNFCFEDIYIYRCFITVIYHGYKYPSALELSYPDAHEKLFSRESLAFMLLTFSFKTF